MLLNNTNTTNNNTTNNNIRAEWKLQLIIKNNFISVKDFKDTRSIYSASKPIEMFMGSDTKNVIDTLFDSILNRINKQWKHQIKEEVDLLMKVLNYYVIIFREKILEEVDHI